MTFKIASRVWQTSATTGTGTLSLDASSNPTGYRTFASAIGNGNSCPYVIDDGQGHWEEGIGNVATGPDTLARTTVINNSLGTTALINFPAGTKTVQVCPIGSRAWWWNSAPATDHIGIMNSAGGMDPISIAAYFKKLLTTDGDVALNDSGTVIRATMATALKKLLTTDGDIAQNVGGTIVARTAPPNRNVLINAGFAIDQRNAGVSTAISDDTYCFDRWYALTQTAAVNVSQVTEPEDGYPFAIRLTQNQSTAQRMGLAQIVEGVNCKHLRGGAGTLVPRVRCSSSQAIRYAILGWTGTEDSVTSDVVSNWTSGTYTAGNFFLASNISVLAVGAQTPSANAWTSLAALSASMGSSFKNIIVFIWTEGAAAQNVTFDLDFVQLESGATATAFERRDYGSELLRCQRYFETIAFTSAAATGISTSTTAAGAIITYQVKKRAQPTVTLPAAGQSAGKMSFTTSAGGYPATTGTNSPVGNYANSVFIVGSGYVGLTSGAASQLFCTTFATVTFDAEI